MVKFRKTCLTALYIFLPLIVLHCSKYKEPAPFFDDLVMNYKYKSLEITYKVNKLGDNRFEMIETTQRGKALGDKTHKLVVNEYGKVLESTFEPYEGKFSPIWIPVQKMEIGDIFDGRSSVTRRDQWKIWDVLVIKDTLTPSEKYFDLNTGFLVGSFARTVVGSGGLVLVNTNVDLPIVGTQ